jgi:hypothetical protein
VLTTASAYQMKIPAAAYSAFVTTSARKAGKLRGIRRRRIHGMAEPWWQACSE